MIRETVADGLEAINSGANDVIVAKQYNGLFMSTPIIVQVGKIHNKETFFKSREDNEMKIYINGKHVQTDSRLLIEDNGKACFNRVKDPINLTHEEWKNVQLNPGLNSGQFVVESLKVKIDFNVFLYDQNTRFIISDIDGTITICDFQGRIGPMFGIDSDQERVVELFDKINKNGYEVIYLTGRSTAELEGTKEYLFKVFMLSIYVDRVGSGYFRLTWLIPINSD